MRRSITIHRLAWPAVFLIVLLLTTLSAHAASLSPVKLKVGGKDVALKSAVLFDGREVYLPLESLRAFSVEYAPTRNDESIIATYPGGTSSEVALARPGRAWMVPLTALVKRLKIEFTVENDVCDVRPVGSKIEAKPVSRTAPVQHIDLPPMTRPGPRQPGAVSLGPPRASEPAHHTTVVVDLPPAPKREPRSPNLVRVEGGPIQQSGEPDGDPPPRDHGTKPAEPTLPPIDPTTPKAPEQPGTGPQQPGASPQQPGAAPQPPAQPAVLPAVKPGLARVTSVQFQAIDDTHCRLRLTVSGKAAADVVFLSDQSQLAIDIPNAALGTEMQEWQVEHPFLKLIHAVGSPKPDSVRLVLDLTQLVSYRLTQTPKEGITLALGLPRNAGKKMSDVLVVVDAGHGGSSTGCHTYVGGKCIWEKSVTLLIAKKLQSALEDEGVHVMMTRTGDSFVGLPERPGLANSRGADLFVSIHIDDCGIANSASGSTAYYHLSDTSSRALAQSIISRIARVSGLPNRGAHSDGVLYASGLSVLRNSNVPATLVEVGYFNNSRDRSKILSDGFQDAVAHAIADGIRGYVESALPATSLTSTGVESNGE